jgi:Ca2+-binding EF-hand superfamily protein
MPNSTPASVSRYRPAVLVLAGAAAAYATYLVYSISQVSASDGLHRSNAVRRPNARQRRRASQPDRLSALNGELPVFPDYDYHGVMIPLGPGHLISRDELRDVITQRYPPYTAEQVEIEVDSVYDTFLDRMFAEFFPDHLPSRAQIEILARWVADHIDNQISNQSTAVERANLRYVERLRGTSRHAVDGAQSIAPTELSWDSDDDTEGEALDPDGQTLQRTLYHIAEDRARHEGVVHRGVTCNGCDEKPIRGIRWHCANCADFDLCSNCEATNSHIKTHIFYKIRVPAPFLGIPKQASPYPGKPHMMTSSVQAALKKRLIGETDMESEEIEALWEQFTCLAGTEWLTDPNEVAWALDRSAFNHAFVPRYKSFVAAPNLIYDRIFAYYDSDKNGLIGFEEWIKGVNGMHATDPHVKSKIVFNGYDIDGDGYISRKDILRIFRAYYAIEQEATGAYVADITEEFSVRNALDTIRSGQPLGSAFMPHGVSSNDSGNPRLQQKPRDDFENTQPVLQEDRPDVAERAEILEAASSHNVGREGLPSSDQSSAVTDRWGRRDFYIDEEEGLTRPHGAEDDLVPGAEGVADTTSPAADQEDATDQPNARPRWSGSSSRVRFQDDVDFDTRSNASTSSRPFGDRWGGFEIPEPEKDLGKEVLYQITQQGFNELLDPIFEERENNAMDAHATRSERRKRASELEIVSDCLKSQEHMNMRSIAKLGIFQFSKRTLTLFCNMLNTGFCFETFRAIFRGQDGTAIDHEQARHRLARIYKHIEDSILGSISVPQEWTVDEMVLWNTWLCSNRLRNEAIAAVLDCASHLGWIPHAPSGKIGNYPPTHIVPLDPTMPQFRPNSLADLSYTGTNYEPSALKPDALHSMYHKGQIKSSPSGPFMVCTLPKSGNDQRLEGSLKEATEQGKTALLGASSTGEQDQTMESGLGQILTTEQGSTFYWSSLTDNPTMHILQIESADGAEHLRCSTRPVIHNTNPFHPDTDQSKSLYRRVRDLAMDPDAMSHSILLASLDAVQQQIHDRKGSGMINFEEFDKHMQEGSLRFLESWMEWVSI